MEQAAKMKVPKRKKMQLRKSADTQNCGAGF
jgi:hypothetical protein